MTADVLYLDDILETAKRYAFNPVFYALNPFHSSMWNRAVSRELPGNYPYNIKTELVKRYLQPWERPSKALVQEVEARLRKELKKVVEGEFAEHVHGGLQLTVWYDLGWSESPFCIDNTQEYR